MKFGVKRANVRKFLGNWRLQCSGCHRHVDLSKGERKCPFCGAETLDVKKRGKR